MRCNYAGNKRIYIYTCCVPEDRFLHYPLFHFFGVDDDDQFDNARSVVSGYFLSKIMRTYHDINELVHLHTDCYLDDLSADMLRSTLLDFKGSLTDDDLGSILSVRAELSRLCDYAYNGHLVRVHDDYFDFLSDLLIVDERFMLDTLRPFFEAFFDVFTAYDGLGD